MPIKKEHIPRPKPGKHTLRYLPGEKAFESLVARGVKRFILKDSTIREFFAALRSAARKNIVPPHPLSARVLSRIVKEAMQKRNEHELKKTAVHKQSGGVT